MIMMHSSEEHLMFGLIVAFIVAIILLTYMLFDFVASLITDRIYYRRKKIATRELKKAIRQIRKENQETYMHDITALYQAIEKGEETIE